MVRVDGIEPTTSAWKADVLPLNYTRENEAIRCRARHDWVKSGIQIFAFRLRGAAGFSRSTPTQPFHPTRTAEAGRSSSQHLQLRHHLMKIIGQRRFKFHQLRRIWVLNMQLSGVQHHAWDRKLFKTAGLKAVGGIPQQWKFQ